MRKKFQNSERKQTLAKKQSKIAAVLLTLSL
jgi:hypothetical protein